MWNEHNLVPDAQECFTAYNAGNKINTTPKREVVFVFLHSANPPPITCQTCCDEYVSAQSN